MATLKIFTKAPQNDEPAQTYEVYKHMKAEDNGATTFTLLKKGGEITTNMDFILETEGET